MAQKKRLFPRPTTRGVGPLIFRWWTGNANNLNWACMSRPMPKCCSPRSGPGPCKPFMISRIRNWATALHPPWYSLKRTMKNPDHLALVLAIWADVDGEEWSRAFRAISDAVFAMEKSWSQSDRDDYINAIHFEILPLNK